MDETGATQQEMGLLHLLEESRSLLLPSGALLMPGVITQYASLYVQYVPMISRSSEGADTCEIYLKYWVLNAMVSALLQNFASILWWIPLSSHATFILWCYLCLPRSISSWYGMLHEELCDFGLLPGSHQTQDLAKTRVGQMGITLLEALPKAKDSPDDSPDNHVAESTADDTGKDPTADKAVDGEVDLTEEDETKTPSAKEKMKARTRVADSGGDADDVPVSAAESSSVVETPTSLRRSTRTRRRRVS